MDTTDYLHCDGCPFSFRGDNTMSNTDYYHCKLDDTVSIHDYKKRFCRAGVGCLQKSKFAKTFFAQTIQQKLSGVQKELEREEEQDGLDSHYRVITRQFLKEHKMDIAKLQEILVSIQKGN